MANAFTHGRLTTVQISSTYFAAISVNYDEKLSDLTDITYTVSGGATFGYFLPGYNFATGVLTFVYDTLNQPVLSPQDMIPGVLMTVTASPDGTKLYSFQAYSGEFQWAGGPKSGPVMCSTNYTTNGTITRPLS